MEKLVKRANEIYHDLAGKDYDKEVGDNLIIEDKIRWVDIRPFFKDKKPLKILDIGTGTGFVPLMVADVLKESDSITCSDVSKGILDIAKNKLIKMDFKCKFEFVFIDDRLPFNKDSFDIVVLNSTLHHILNYRNFLGEVDFILKPGGLFLICHEPNKLFRKSMSMQLRYNLLNLFFNTRDFVRVNSEKLRIDWIFEGIFYHASRAYQKEVKKRNMIARKVSETLINENLIDKPLTYKEILYDLIDLQVSSGFHPFKLMPNYQVIYFKSFNHLRGMPRLNPKLSFLERYEEDLIDKFPKHGDLFTIVLKKPE